MVTEITALRKVARSLDPVMIPLIIALVGVAAFLLGRYSALEEARPELQIIQNGQSK